MPGRMPDFIVIGVMKAGTTTAYRWLDQHPDTALPAVKEPDFFCFDHNYRRGIEDYARHFAEAPAAKVTGEASVKYMAPRMADSTAARIATHVPDAKLIAILRDPVERLRSEYRYNRQRGWETRSLQDALIEPGNPYVGKSLYFRCLLPYLERFDRSQLLVIQTEELDDSGPAWRSLLEFLGLDFTPTPTQRYLETDALPQMRSINGFLEKRMSRRVIRRLPARVRKFGQRLVTDNDPAAATRRRIDSEAPVPTEVLELLERDAARLAETLSR